MSGSLTKLSVLVVDDSLHIRRLVKHMLHAMGGPTLYEAKSAEEAMTLIERKAIDIAFVDWMLEGDGNGLELIRAIRNMPGHDINFLPIIMMTGHTERSNIEAARDVGVTEFLAKPFTAKGLFQRLQFLVENPRPFVRTRHYFGPDRRRRQRGPGPDGERRRRAPRKETAS